LLQIIGKIENTKQIENTGHMHCPVLYFHIYTRQTAKTPDCPVKYRTHGNPNLE